MRHMILTTACCLALPLASAAQTELAPITVTQPPAENQNSDTTNLGKDAANATLGGYLDNMPNVDSASYGEAVGRPVVRGMSGYRIKILHNDNEVSDLSAMSQDHAVAVAPRASERIELLKGPASLLYAAQAGGVVRIRDVLDNPFLTSGWRGQVAGDLRASPSSHNLDTRLTWSDDTWAWHVGGLTQDAQAYESGRGERIADSDLSTDQIQLAAGWRPGSRSEWLLSTTQLEKDYGIPNDTPEATRINMQREDYSLKYRYDPAPIWLDRINVDAHYSDYLHDETEGGRKDGLFGQQQQQAALQLSWSAALWSGETRLSASNSELRVCHEHGACSDFSRAPRSGAPLGESILQYIESTGLPYSHGHPMPDTQSLLWQLSNVADRPLGADYRISVGLHTQWRELKPDANNIQEQWVYPEQLDAGYYNTRREDAWSVSLGLRREPLKTTPLSWELSLSALQRLPSVDELYWNGFHHATESYIFGTPHLDTERSLNLDADLSWSKPRHRWQLSGFFYRFQDYIFQDQGYTDEGVPLSDPFHLSDVWFTRQSDARFIGGSVRYEHHSQAQAEHTWMLWLQADALHAEQSDGRHLPRTAPANLSAGLRYEHSNWLATASLKHVFEARHLAPNESATDAYNWVSLYLEHRLQLGQQALDLWLKADNLFDAYAQNHLSVLKDTAPLPGRQISAGARWKF